jgi:hypothetical protein
VKITVIGRPGKVQHLDSFVTFILESKKTPSLPKGLPEIKNPTSYLVMVANKHWKKVEATLAQYAEDSLIVEGFPTLQTGFQGICVLASNVTTKQQQKDKAELQKQQSLQNQPAQS